jgi:DNA polymerase elongation subunit (family B)
MIVGDTTYVFGLGEYTLPDDSSVVWKKFDDESILLAEFIQTWSELAPDIITGWNVKFFDIPYLVNRCKRVLGDTTTNKLSPWNRLIKRSVKHMNREHPIYIIEGIATLDYLDLYRTFTYTNQESYKLDHIVFVELGERKVSYEEFDNLTDFYKQDFQKFMEYNIKDTELVCRLESKMKLIELAIALAYSAKVNLADVFSQVRTWDQIIYHYLHERKTVIPLKRHGHKDEKYAGAYVKDPIVGKHDQFRNQNRSGAGLFNHAQQYLTWFGTNVSVDPKT